MKSDSLFNLIQSLSPGERRHFKLFAKRAGRKENNYIMLFDAIQKQTEYDEIAIKKRFEGFTFVKQLHVTKNQLQQLILKALRNVSTNDTAQRKILQLLVDIETLYHRELFTTCNALCKKAAALAEENEKFALHLEVMFWMRRLSVHQSTPIMNTNQVQTLLIAERDCVFNIAQIRQLWELSTNIFDYYDAPKARMKPAFYQHPGMIMHGQPPLTAEIMYAHVNYIKEVITHHPVKAKQIMKDLIQRLESHPERMKNDPAPLVTAMSNLIGLMLRLGEHDQIPDWLERMRTIPDRFQLKTDQKYTARLVLRIYNIELEFYRDTKNWQAAKTMIPEVIQFLEHKPKRIPEDYRILLSYQFAFVHFCDRDFNQALDWTNVITMGRYSDLRLDIQRFARFLNLMIHYELGNEMVLKYGIQSTRRFLGKHRELDDFDRTFLRFMGRLVTRAPYDHKFLFRQWEQELFLGKEPVVDSEIEDFLNLRNWVSSYI